MKKRLVGFLILNCVFAILVFRFGYPSKLFKGSVEDNEQLVVHRAANREEEKSNPIQRYDPAKDPRNSVSAARDYYARRETMIREFHGNGQIDNALTRLNGDQDLIMWIGVIQRQEMIEGLPRVAALLAHPDVLVQRAAAYALCSFGDQRGFDFLMSKMEKPGSVEWWSAFTENFGDSLPAEYLARIKALIAKKEDDKNEAYVIAKVVAQFGDPSSLNVLLPFLEKSSSISVETILTLGNVEDPRVISFIQSISNKNLSRDQRAAVDVVLAKQGDIPAKQRVLEAAKNVIELPQPQNIDGSWIPELRPTVSGEKTPSWDSVAVFALENGLEVLSSEETVPLLRNIAIQAKNVRFSKTATELLAKIGTPEAREALWEAAASIQQKKRPFEDTICTPTAKALILFNDSKSETLATKLFSGDEHGMKFWRLMAETRGWEGVFKLGLFY